MVQKSLKQICLEHSGKLSNKWHIYLNEYERIFFFYHDRPVNLFEIGIQNGGSLEIWSKYFPNAQKLVGCDIDPQCGLLNYEDSRVAVVIGDANTDAVQAQVLGHAATFDIIIDDGSHRSGDIVRSFCRYFPYLANGGILIAEDMHASYWQDYQGGLLYRYSSMEFFKRLVDVVNHEHWGTKRSRRDILKPFLSKYRVAIDDGILQHIHSLEFINSMCVIRKSAPENNRLGPRVISGSEEKVASGHKALNARESEAPSQKRYIFRR